MLEFDHPLKLLLLHAQCSHFSHDTHQSQGKAVKLSILACTSMSSYCTLRSGLRLSSNSILANVLLSQVQDSCSANSSVLALRDLPSIMDCQSWQYKQLPDTGNNMDDLSARMMKGHTRVGMRPRKLSDSCWA